MDLQKITLRNFRNYSKQQLDLTTDSFWIFRGKNGAGKSSLVCDAVSFALFGNIQAMKGKADLKISPNDLIKRGQVKGFVEVEFDHLKDHYRLRRERSAKGNGKETVYLQKNGKVILDYAKQKNANTWIEANLVKQNDFLNTTLVQQNEMTKTLEMTAGERKDYIERLFGIDGFERMASIAKDKADAMASVISNKDEVIKDRKLQLIDVDSIKEEIKKVGERQAEIKGKVSSERQAQQDLEKQQDEVRALQRQQQELEIRKEETTKRKQEFQLEINQLEEELQQLTKLEENQESITTQFEELEALRKQVQVLQAKQQQQQQLLAHQQTVSQSIGQQEQALKGQAGLLQQALAEATKRSMQLQVEIGELLQHKQRATELHARLDDSQLAEQLAAMQVLQQKDSQLQLQIEAAKTKLQELQRQEQERLQETRKEADKKAVYQAELAKLDTAAESIQATETMLVQLEEQLETLQDKRSTNDKQLAQLEQAKQQLQEQVSLLQQERQNLQELGTQATCPHCHQELKPEHLQQLSSELDHKVVDLTVASTQHEQTSKEVRQVVDGLSRRINQLRTQRSEAQTQLRELHTTVQNRQLIVEKLEQSEKSAAELKAFEEKGGIKASFPDLQQKLDHLLQQRGKLQYDKTPHDQLQAKYQEELQLQAELKAIEKQLQALPERKQDLGQLQQQVTGKTEQYEKINQLLASGEFALENRAELEKIITQVEQLTTELQQLAQIEKEYQIHEEGGIRQQYEQLQQLASSRKSLQGRMKEKQGNVTTTDEQLQQLVAKLQATQFQHLMQRLEKLKEQLVQVHNKLEQLAASNAALATELKLLQQQLTEQMDLQEQIRVAESAIKEKKELWEYYMLLEKSFQDIGGRILARLRNRINDESIAVLSKLGNEQLHGITLDNKYGLSIQTPHGDEMPYFFSGGQKVRIGFAFRLALAKTLSEYRGGKLETLIIDEGSFGALDEDGQDGIVEVFNSLKGEFQRMLFISHLPGITENLPGTQVVLEAGQIVQML